MAPERGGLRLAAQPFGDLLDPDDVVRWSGVYQPGPRLTQETASRLESFLERVAVSYLEEVALTEAVDAVLGPGNPATPFIGAGLEQVLDARSPYLLRFAGDHEQKFAIAIAIVGVFALVLMALAGPPDSK